MASFVLLLILTLWSYTKLMMSNPGYVPRGYSYKQENMSFADRYVFEKIKLAKYSTERQALDGMRNLPIDGSVMDTNSER